MSFSTTTEQQAFQSVKRACYAGLDSVTLRTEVARRMTHIIPVDAHHFSTMDPDTGLMNHSIGTEFSSIDTATEFYNAIYPNVEAISFIEQARSGRVVARDASEELTAVLHAEGYAHGMRALFFDAQALWGSWCVVRGVSSPPFDVRAVRFIERVAPHVSEGLKHAALLELAGDDREVEVEHIAVAAAASGFLILDARGNVTLRTPAAAACLDDLGGPGCAAEGRLPFAVLSVRGWLLRMRSVPDRAPADARLRARGRSGAWYTLRATLSEPDAAGASSTVVSIESMDRRDVAPLLFRLYGLSPREREVILGVVRGESTKRIAHHLGISTHTAQDYLDKACDKVGVRGRKALIARLFRDGFAPSMAA